MQIRDNKIIKRFIVTSNYENKSMIDPFLLSPRINRKDFGVVRISFIIPCEIKKNI